MTVEVAQAPADASRDVPVDGPAGELLERFGPELRYQETVDGISNVWVPRERLQEVMGQLKGDYPMLFDLSVIDERVRTQRTRGSPIRLSRPSIT